MTDYRISGLNPLAKVDLEAGDELAVVDGSASETKRITAKALVEKGVSLIDAGSIPGSAIATLGANTVVTASIADGNVTNAKLQNYGFELGGLSIALGSIDNTPALDLVDATNYPASSLTGTVSNNQLAGSIANNKLANSSISLGGVNINLGDTIATPVFDLTNATNYPASSLTGTLSNSQLAGSISNSKLENSSITIGSVVLNLGDNDSSPSFDLSDATNYPASSLTGTITNTQLAGSIQGSKILSGSISSTELGTNSVTAVELANLSVDTAALIDSSVTDAKISAVSGTKITAGSLPATAINASNLGTGLAISSNNLVIDNTVAAGTAAKVTFSSVGIITGSASLAPSDLPIADATNVGGVSIGGGLAITGAGALSLSNSITAATVSGIQFNAFGQIVSATSLVSSDLPISNSSQVGGVKITSGGGLSVDGSGGLSTSTSGISGGTYTKLTINAKGVATAGTVLAASDIPDLDANKISSGTLDAARIASSSIAGVKLSDASTTIFGGPDSTTNITSFPSAGDFKGQRFWDEYTQDEYIWTGASWTAITTTAGELTLLGTYSASDNTLSSITTEGGAAGLTATAALPAASAQNKQGYVVVDDTGTGSSPAPTVTLNAPDYLLSDGSNWKHIDVSGAMAATAATQVSVNTFAHGGSTDVINTVQASLENLATNRLRNSGGDITGALTIKEAGSLVFEGTDAESSTTTLSVVDPDANRTINLPNISGTLITSGDSNTVTATMVDGSLTHANLASSAAIAFSQLAGLTAASILIGNSSGVVTESTVTGDISITDAGVTSIGAGKIDNAMVSSTAAISGSKITAASTSASGTVQLNDSTSSTSTSEAATANALKETYDLANTANTAASAAYSASGGTISGNVTISSGNELRITEPSSGSNYTAFKAQDQSDADIVLTLPAAAPAGGDVLKANASTPTTLEWGPDVTDTAAANLTGATLASGVVNSSLTSVGTLASLTVTATITGSVSGSAGSCTGNSGGFTAGSASNLNAGTLGDARFPATLPAISGENLTSLNASNISSGTIAAARIPTLNQSTTGSSGSCTGDATGLSGTPNITVGTIDCGNITGTGTVSDIKGDLRTIVQTSKSSQHTIVASDAGKHSINTSGGWVFDTSTGFTAGQAITLINADSADQTITSTGVTLYNAADGSTPSKIAARGMATVLCTASNTYYISGAGLS
jgi:hypothetical protein